MTQIRAWTVFTIALVLSLSLAQAQETKDGTAWIYQMAECDNPMEVDCPCHAEHCGRFQSLAVGRVTVSAGVTTESASNEEPEKTSDPVASDATGGSTLRTQSAAAQSSSNPGQPTTLRTGSAARSVVRVEVSGPLDPGDAVEIEFQTGDVQGIAWTGARNATVRFTASPAVQEVRFPFEVVPVWPEGDYVFQPLRMHAGKNDSVAYSALRITSAAPDTPGQPGVTPPILVPLPGAWALVAALAGLALLVPLRRRRA